MEAVKDCSTCISGKYTNDPYCHACSQGSAPDNPYPMWKSVEIHCPDYHKDDPEEVDIVNKPPHYRNHPSGVECIQITEHMNFCLGNAMKYIWRAGDKHETPLEDLKKAKWYIEREIARLEKA